MLDEANSDFVNGVVTILRYFTYFVIGWFVLYLVARHVIAPIVRGIIIEIVVPIMNAVRRIFPGIDERARRKVEKQLRDLGYTKGEPPDRG